MALYSEKVMDHFRNPRNLGKMEDADGVGEVGNAKCGDIMRMYIKVDPETQVITDVKFNTFGCGSAIAASSMATEMIKGKPVDEALQLSNKAVVEALDGLPAQKIHCSVLAEEAVQAPWRTTASAAEPRSEKKAARNNRSGAAFRSPGHDRCRGDNSRHRFARSACGFLHCWGSCV